MSFEFRTQLEDRQSVERFSGEFVQTVQDAEANRGATAEPARARDFFYRRTRKGVAALFGSLKEKIGSPCNDRPRL
jgi:hypothetical protein